MWTAIGSFLAHLVSADNPLWLYYPLCLVVGLVYKATKFDGTKKIILAALHFFASVTVGMFLLGLVLYAVSAFL